MDRSNTNSIYTHITHHICMLNTCYRVLWYLQACIHAVFVCVYLCSHMCMHVRMCVLGIMCWFMQWKQVLAAFSTKHGNWSHNFDWTGANPKIAPALVYVWPPEECFCTGTGRGQSRRIRLKLVVKPPNGCPVTHVRDVLCWLRPVWANEVLIQPARSEISLENQATPSATGAL